MRALLGNTLYYMLLTSAVQAGGITMTSLVIGFLPFAVTIIGSRDRHAVPLSRLIPSLLFCAAGAVCVGWQAVMSSVSGGTSPLGLLCALVAQVGKDPLTGLQDRGQLNAKGPAMLAVASRSGLAVSLIMIDIDHFKYINDKYGHPLGDRVLCDVTAVITREKREGDELFRYGGKEFVLLCPETAPGAQTIAERVRAAVENTPHPGLQRPVTISIGIATFPAHAGDFAALLKQADEALYWAKVLRRNRICNASI